MLCLSNGAVKTPQKGHSMSKFVVRGCLVALVLLSFSMCVLTSAGFIGIIRQVVR